MRANHDSAGGAVEHLRAECGPTTPGPQATAIEDTMSANLKTKPILRDNKVIGYELLIEPPVLRPGELVRGAHQFFPQPPPAHAEAETEPPSHYCPDCGAKHTIKQRAR